MFALFNLPIDHLHESMSPFSIGICACIMIHCDMEARAANTVSAFPFTSESEVKSGRMGL